jgi:thiol-disulfide isomerase/thioredoxin
MRRPLLAVVLAAGLVAGCGNNGLNLNSGTSPQLKTVGGVEGGVFPVGDREPAPDLSGVTLDGARLDVFSLRGKVVVLNFWASWCAPCRAEARNLEAVSSQTKALGVEFVGIDIKDDETAARAFVAAKHVSYPSLYDQPGMLLLAFRGQAPQSPPTTIVLDRQGRVAARFLQAVTETELLGPVQVIARERT